ncbi:MAG: PEP-CTERM sorting domain-containing protein [bacterium]|nr:PEP-CTERM sorting domain-containing protein [bacterium]
MRKVIFLAVMCLFVSISAVNAYPVVDGWNINFTPYPGVYWGATEVAWLYSPLATYDLARIEFNDDGGYEARNMTMQLRTNDNGNVGSVLSSGTFLHETTAGWKGADITPYQVIAGQSYWITFWYCGGLNAPITSTPGAVKVPMRYGFSNDSNSYSNYYDGHMPIARFMASTPIPEPGTLMLLGTGLVGLLGLRRKNR